MELAKIEPRQVETTPTTVMAVIDRAIASGASVETLERLMVMQERWEANEARKAYFAALTAAKAELKPIIKDKKVNFTTSKGTTDYNYEGMDTISEQVDPILSKHGLSYRYRTGQDNGAVVVTCILSHQMGHSEETTLSGPRDDSGNKNQIQGIGSTVTYLQRYTLKAALGLAAAKDTDAIDTTDHTLINAEQFQELQQLMEESGSLEEKLLAAVKAETLEKLNKTQFDQAVATMKGMIARRKASANAK